MAIRNSHETGLLGALFMCLGIAELSESPELNSALVVLGGLLPIGLLPDDFDYISGRTSDRIFPSQVNEKD